MPLLSLLFRLLFIFLSTPALAVTNPQSSGDITSSATIPLSSLSAPALRTPGNNSVTKNPYEQFSWIKSEHTPTVNIHHYTLYIDDIIVATDITHAANQDTPEFTATVDDDNVYLNLKAALAEGLHTWQVIVYSDEELSATSEQWRFTVDTTAPLIILTDVQSNHFFWSTLDPSSIPPPEERDLIVHTSHPLFQGMVEANSNLKITLVCPASPPSCQDQEIIINDDDGKWKHRFYHLLPTVTYTAYISTTDPANNSTIFPVFTVTYLPPPPIIEKIFPQPSPSPTPTPVPSVSPSPPPPSPPYPPPPPISPPPSPPPPPPPPPPLPPPTPLPRLQAGLPRLQAGLPRLQPEPYLLPSLSLFGLLLHLSLAAIGSGIKLTLFPKLLASLLIPPLARLADDLTLAIKTTPTATIATLPYTTLSIFSLKDLKTHLKTLSRLPLAQVNQLIRPLLKHPNKQLVSKSTGQFNFRLPPGTHLILAQKPGYFFPDSQLRNKKPHPLTFIYQGQIVSIDPHAQQQQPSPRPAPPPSTYQLQSSQGTWLFPLDQKDQRRLRPLERFQISCMGIRSIPLFAALLTSFYATVFNPSFIAITIALVSSLLATTQYLYPVLAKNKLALKKTP